MSDMLVQPAGLSGSVTAPPSKSAAHRALICGALTGKGCRVFPISGSQDMDATLGVLKAMGSDFTQEGASVQFHQGNWASQPVTLDCGESGSTLRFLLPVAAALGIPGTFTGHGRLPERPIDVLTQQMSAHGISFSGDSMPFSISGRLTGGSYLLPGNISSQFISGLLMALPLAQEDSQLRLSSPLQSAGYVALTLDALEKSGIQIQTVENGWDIPGGQRYRLTGSLKEFAAAGAWKNPQLAGYKNGDKVVEGDYSNAAFWLCAGAISGAVQVHGLRPESAQGDKAIVSLLREMGASIQEQAGCVSCQSAPLHGIRIDAGPIPDLIPILAVTAAFAEGDTEIYNAARLRIKESDRLATVRALLEGLGGHVEEFPDRLVIHGGGLVGGQVDGANDHRIVMAAAIAATGCRQPVQIFGAEAVRKSYPNFFEEFQSLGGCVHVI